jgi:30S ribosomal protein S31
MGRGDKRTRKGKIFAGSYGKTRPQGKKKPQRQQPKLRETKRNSYSGTKWKSRML